MGSRRQRTNDCWNCDLHFNSPFTWNPSLWSRYTEQKCHIDLDDTTNYWTSCFYYFGTWLYFCAHECGRFGFFAELEILFHHHPYLCWSHLISNLDGFSCNQGNLLSGVLTRKPLEKREFWSVFLLFSQYDVPDLNKSHTIGVQNHHSLKSYKLGHFIILFSYCCTQF